jgi:hypothetical protein
VPSFFVCNVSTNDLLYTPPGYVYVEKTVFGNTLGVRVPSLLMDRKGRANVFALAAKLPPCASQVSNARPRALRIGYVCACGTQSLCACACVCIVFACVYVCVVWCVHALCVCVRVAVDCE